MKTIIMAIFCAVSLAVALGFFIKSLKLGKAENRSSRVLTPIQLTTIGVFAAVVLVFLPITYLKPELGDPYTYIRPLLLAVHNSFRVFILDGDFDTVTNALVDVNDIAHPFISFYIAVLYVVAPVLTFGNVLSLFNNIADMIRFSASKKKKYYILSELNEKSIALAKSIRQYNNTAMIAFADVYDQGEGSDHELLQEARSIKAVLLKRDITRLDIASKTGKVKLFLIGEDESENVSRAAKITAELDRKNAKHNVKIFVFCQSIGGAHVINSLKYDNLIEYSYNKDSEGKTNEDECFKLRRVDEKRQLIWSVVPQMKLFDIAKKNNNTLSVLIVGFGSYGLEFFKTILWFFQFVGYKLQITIVDKAEGGADKKNHVASVIDRHCPDVLKTNRSNVDGDAYYDIEILPGVDVVRADLDDLLLYNGKDEVKIAISRRLKGTNLAFVSLGDDDTNIEVAVHLRALFDRANKNAVNDTVCMDDERVSIYSVVYDDRKSGILQNETSDEETAESSVLVDHTGKPYNIRFIGSLSAQYDYKTIYNSALEAKAYEHHVNWVNIEDQIQRLKTLNAEQRKYEKYEYYRLSSIARELYIKATEGMEASQADRDKGEHMRWNAYTRSIGYAYQDGIRNDRALLHDNLVAYEELDDLEKLKDHHQV